MLLEHLENPSEKLQTLLLQGLEMAHADLGMVQLYNNEKKVLEVVAQSGFTREFLDVYKKIKEFEPTACGRALGVGLPVMIDDVNEEKSFARYASGAKSAGFRAVLATPLFSKDEKIVGVISVHFKEPHEPSDKTHSLPRNYLQKVANVLLEMQN